jgi:hypothetical protein
MQNQFHYLSFYETEIYNIIFKTSLFIYKRFIQYSKTVEKNIYRLTIYTQAQIQSFLFSLVVVLSAREQRGNGAVNELKNALVRQDSEKGVYFAS